MPGPTLLSPGLGPGGVKNFRTRISAQSTELINTFEGGTDAATITTGNSGGLSGDSFDTVSIVSLGTATYSTTNKYRGNVGAVLTVGATSGLTYLEYISKLQMSSTGQLYGRIRFRVPTLPATDVRFAVVTDSAQQFVGDWRINSLGKIEMRSGTGTLLATSTTVIAANTWVDVGIRISSFTTSSNLETKIYTNPLSNVEDETMTSSAVDTFRSGGQNRARVGLITSSVTNLTIHIDDVQWSKLRYPIAAGTIYSEQVFGSAALSVESSLTVVGNNTTFASSTLSSDVSLTTQSRVDTTGSAALTIQSNMAVTGTRVVSGSATLSVQSNMDSIATVTTTPPNAVLSAQSNMTVQGTVVTKLRNTLEGGTNGVAVSTGNSGGASGTAFTIVTVAGTSTVTYDSTRVKHGAMGLKIVTGGTSENAFVALPLSSAGTSGAAQCYMYLTAYPTVQTRIMQFTTAANAGRDSVAITSTGKLRWDSFNGTDVSTSASVPLNTWFRVSMIGDVSSSEVHLYTDVESAIPAESLTGLSPLSGDTFSYVRFGWTSSSAGFTAWLDTLETINAAVVPTPFASVVSGSAILSQQSNVSVVGSVTTLGTVSLSAQSSLSSIGTRVVLGNAVLSAQTIMNVDGFLSGIITGAVQLNSQLNMTVTGNATAPWVFEFIELSSTRITTYQESKSVASIPPEYTSTIMSGEGG